MDLKLDNVRFSYDSGSEQGMAFDHLFAAGSLTAVMGASGSGKSTLFALVAGFETPIDGRICFASDDLTKASPSERPVSMVFQENNLFAHMTVYQNVAIGLSASLRLDAAQKEQVFSALDGVGLGSYADRLPGALSGGERQRVALARVLVRKRPILLLDEAFDGLGPGLRLEMLELVRSLHEQEGLTTLMISHSPDDARKIADQIVFLDKGRIVATGPKEAVLDGELRDKAVETYMKGT